jgi:hypothetical protein
MTHIPQGERRPLHRSTAFGVAAVPLALGAVLMISDHGAGIAWALLVCGAGLLSVALTQPRRNHEPPSRGRTGSAAQRKTSN